MNYYRVIEKWLSGNRSKNIHEFFRILSGTDFLERECVDTPRNRSYFFIFFEEQPWKVFPRISRNRPISRIISLREQLVSGTGPTACPCLLTISSTLLLNFIWSRLNNDTIPIPIYRTLSTLEYLPLRCKSTFLSYDYRLRFFTSGLKFKLYLNFWES